jgi:hypothetical protein
MIFERRADHRATLASIFDHQAKFRVKFACWHARLLAGRLASDVAATISRVDTKLILLNKIQRVGIK